ncbi:anti-sigma factor domain-containing protein [Bacillus sinesaloumensis]|uniref:anti-sigma factor domain-containing protein n=1 Tax=Litchfieldia sinesaloumensis TaxID=1926280 RepID=UPI00098889DF|nr:anti-sigma factor domain-containing protein [Bacillus sinesaloumensis]
MKKGIVLDVNDEYVTMLTPEGEFVRAKHTKKSYEIGEETTFFPINDRVSRTSKQRFFQVKKWRYAFASSLVAILLLSIFIPFSPRNEVYAYMSIDINPSFEVGLDDELRVVSLEALNDEAKKLVESIPDWKNSNLDSITERIIQFSKENGYLNDGKEVLITTVVADTHNTDVDRELQQGIQEIKEEYEKEEISVTSVKSTVETRKSAKEKGISTGKLLIRENKVPKPVQKEKAQPVEQKKQITNQQDNAIDQNKIEEFKNQGKQRAEEVREELEEKKEQIKEKVKNNVENSNMPTHVKEKLEEKWENNQKKHEEKWEKKQRKQEEKEREKQEKRQNKENNRGKGKENDDD